MQTVPPTLKDEIFAAARPLVTDFAFDKDTASVFDDMINRSVRLIVLAYVSRVATFKGSSGGQR